MSEEPIRYPALNAEALVNTPAHVVAGIAAQILAPEATVVERVRMAFDLLDATVSGIKGLEKLGCHHAGLDNYEEARTNFAEEKAEADILYNSPLIKGDVVDFEEAMAALFSRGVKKKDRPSKFADFVEEHYLSPEAELSRMEAMKRGDIESILAGEHRTDPFAVIAKWVKEGVPASFFVLAQREFPDWWEGYKISQKSRAGRTPPKAKQGRVVKRHDKRKGARLEKNNGQKKKIKNNS
jgi:hypothetical protein